MGWSHYISKDKVFYETILNPVSKILVEELERIEKLHPTIKSNKLAQQLLELAEDFLLENTTVSWGGEATYIETQQRYALLCKLDTNEILTKTSVVFMNSPMAEPRIPNDSLVLDFPLHIIKSSPRPGHSTGRSL